MADLVLIHGGFHGGWSWARVARPLAARGWNVFAPSLTGLADRAHLAAPEVGAATHVADVVGLIEAEELADVILCGHSAGAHVAAAVAEAIPDRIAHQVALDGLVPEDGESVNDVLREVQGVPQLFRQLTAEGDGVSIPPSAFSPEDFGVVDPADAAWLARRLSPHPLRCFEEGVAIGAGFASVPGTYVRSERFEAEYGGRMVERFDADPGWEVLRWDVGHDSMILVPDEVIGVLEGIAAGI